nr:hypothetical protein [uncultured bacterium]
MDLPTRRDERAPSAGLLAFARIKVGADEATALQGGQAKNAFLAVADGETAT